VRPETVAAGRSRHRRGDVGGRAQQKVGVPAGQRGENRTAQGAGAPDLGGTAPQLMGTDV